MNFIPGGGALHPRDRLYNHVACRTKSLTTCVVTHALTNLALDLWIVATKVGFW